jgi:Fe-S-cluster containining protein
LPVVFDRAEIPERRATCNNCAMAGGEGANAISFQPNLKCCTYQPTLPNFLVGAVLSDESPEIAEGKRRVQERIRSRIGVTPQWLSPPRKYRVLHDAARGTSFGRSRALLCPFYVDEGGQCSIWRHREAVCSTFFCKHEAGATAHAFWTAQKQLLGSHEVVLSQWAAREVYPSAAEPAFPRMRLTLEDLEDRPPNEDDYAAGWGEWIGREEEFYRRTFELVSAVDVEKAAVLLEDNERAKTLAASMAERHDEITSPKLATHLVMNPELLATPIGESGAMAVTTYSAYDPMVLIPELWAVLPEFEGTESVTEIKDRLDREKDVTIGDDLLLILQHHAILVPPLTR